MTAAPGPRRLWRFRGGVHPTQHKTESNQSPIAPARIPRRLILPLHQHIGQPAEALVAPGARVLKGEMIARATGFVSAPVHAPTSGTVVDIGEHAIPHPSGLKAPCIVIEPDGLDEWKPHEGIDDYRSLEPSALRNLIREAGIVGLGGAGFPSYIKLNPGQRKSVEILILNGVECEPYITCDDVLMRERAAEIVGGLEIVRHALQAGRCLIAIEDNKPEAIDAMRAAIAGQDGVEVVPVPTLYPQGSEKQLVRVLTGKEVPANGLCINIGVVNVNVGTAAAVWRAIRHGEPLISRIVTVTGSAVGEGRNLDTLLGTPMRDLIEQCGGDAARIERLIMGGPMMGFALHDLGLPVIKTTNCVLAAAPEEIAPARPAMPCIRCGACADVCPINLLPQQLYWYSKHKDLDKVQEYNLFDCIECGCCSYVCPSNIPLVQYFRYAKGDIWTQEREREKSDIARQRFEARQQRIEREKQEREAKRQQKKSALDTVAAARQRGEEQMKSAMQQAEARREAAMQQAGRSAAGNDDAKAPPPAAGGSDGRKPPESDRE